MALQLLIADDDPILRRLYECLIARRASSAGAVKLDLVASAPAGRTLVDTKRYDLALIDLNLGPALSGLNIVAHIRASSPTTPVVVMSSQDDEATRRACLGAGASGFLSKNVDFMASLQSLIDGARPARKSRRNREYCDLGRANVCALG